MTFANILPQEFTQVIAQSGFNAVLVVILLGISWYDRKSERENREKEREKDRVALNRLTRTITEVVLAMSFLPKQFHDAARDTQREIDSDK